MGAQGRRSLSDLLGDARLRSGRRPDQPCARRQLRAAGGDRRQGFRRSDQGGALGAAFQIADDILDAEGDEDKLGKRAGKDAARNKATFVAVLGIDRAKAARDRLVAQAQAAIDEAGLGASGDMLRAAALFIAARTN